MSDYSVDDLLVLPGAGTASGTHLDIKVRAAQMGGHFSMMQGIMHPGELLTPHEHPLATQAVFVIRGTLEFEVGGADGLRFTAPAGSYVVKPKNVVHTFWNAGDEDVDYIEFSTGEDFQQFIEKTGTDGTVKGVMWSVEDGSIHWHLDQVPRLMMQNRLTGIAGLDHPREAFKDMPPTELIAFLRENLSKLHS